MAGRLEILSISVFSFQGTRLRLSEHHNAGINGRAQAASHIFNVQSYILFPTRQNISQVVCKGPFLCEIGFISCFPNNFQTTQSISKLHNFCTLIAVFSLFDATQRATACNTKRYDVKSSRLSEKPRFHSKLFLTRNIYAEGFWCISIHQHIRAYPSHSSLNSKKE